MNPISQVCPTASLSRHGILALAGILGLALMVRLADLGGESLWLDEGFSYMIASRPIPELIRSVLQYDYNPPTYYILLRGWIALFGTSEAALRMPSALLSVLAIALLYRIGVAVSRRSVALTATLLAAVTLYDIRFAQEARAYSLLNCLCALSMLSYLELIKKHSARWVGVYLLSSSLLLYSHPYGIFPLAIQAIHRLIAHWRRLPVALSWKKWLVLQACVGLLFVPWLLRLVSVIGYIQAHPTYLQKPGPGEVFAVFQAMAAYHTGFALLLLAVAALAWWPVPRSGQSAPDPERAPSNGLWFVTVWWVSAFLLPLAASHLVTPVFASHYLIIASFPFYLLIALGIHRIPLKGGRWLVGLLIVALCGVALHRYYPKVQKEQWREAVAWVEREVPAGGTVLFHADFCLTTIYPYYRTRTDLNLKGFPREAFRNQPTPESIGAALDRILPAGGPVWLVESRGEIDRDNLLILALENRLGSPRCTDFKGIRIYCYCDPDRAGAG